MLVPFLLDRRSPTISRPRRQDPLLFSLEAFQADHGDALLLHFGPSDAPRWILIDGGPTPNVYRDTIKPRLQMLRDQFVDEGDALPLEMVMVSHIDDDHIVGIQALMKDLRDSADDSIALPWNVKTLWFNSFDEILGNGDDEIFSELTARVSAAGLDSPLPGFRTADPYAAAVVATVPKGRQLRSAAEGLTIPPNKGFSGLVMAGADRVHRVRLPHGLTFTVLAPDETRVKALQAEWEASLRRQPNVEELARIAANSDRSVANLASIVVLAELRGKRMLLTGDGRSDHTLAGLERAGLLEPGGTLPVDLLKLPHHGSDRNVTQAFFERLPARHYVISANGANDNPDVTVLEMIEAARPDDDDFTIHLTNHSGKLNLKAKLDRFFNQRAARGRNYKLRYREDAGSTARSLVVNLLETLAI